MGRNQQILTQRVPNCRGGVVCGVAANLRTGALKVDQFTRSGQTAHVDAEMVAATVIEGRLRYVA